MQWPKRFRQQGNPYFGIGLTMSKIIAMRVGNMIPGLFIVAVMTYFLDRNEDLSISSLRSIMDGYIGL